jgi:hypothetical protein
LLICQHSPMHSVLQDSFENMQAYLLHIHSFPDATALPTVLKACLVSAADESEIPQAVDIYN